MPFLICWIGFFIITICVGSWLLMRYSKLRIFLKYMRRWRLKNKRIFNLFVICFWSFKKSVLRGKMYISIGRNSK